MQPSRGHSSHFQRHRCEGAAPTPPEPGWIYRQRLTRDCLCLLRMDELCEGRFVATIRPAHQQRRLKRALTMNLDDTTLLTQAHEEAARYALLRRVAPTLRHHLAGEFQPLGMMAALMERRLQQRADPASLVEHCNSLGQLSRQAAEHCMALMNWVAPRQDAEIDLESGVAECVNMLATGLRFRGFALSHARSEQKARVAGPALRTVLPAAIFYLSDSADGPADLHVQAQVLEDQVLIEITVAASDRSSEAPTPVEYRPLQWGDVCALAQAENMALHRQAGALQLAITPLG